MELVRFLSAERETRERVLLDLRRPQCDGIQAVVDLEGCVPAFDQILSLRRSPGWNWGRNEAGWMLCRMDRYGSAP